MENIQDLFNNMNMFNRAALEEIAIYITNSTEDEIRLLFNENISLAECDIVTGRLQDMDCNNLLLLFIKKHPELTNDKYNKDFIRAISPEDMIKINAHLSDIKKFLE